MSDELNITATPEQIAGAVFGNLLATVDNRYMVHIATQLMLTVTTEVGRAFATGKVNEESFADLDKKVPLKIRRRALLLAYDNVVRNLPVDSPFREPLVQRRDRALERMKE